MTELTSINMLTTQIGWIQRQEEPLPPENKGDIVVVFWKY